MLPEYYERFKKEYTDLIIELKCGFESICETEMSTERISVFQQRVIEACTALENEWLVSRNRINRAFEEVCEQLYRITIGDADAADHTGKILDSMADMFDECYENRGCKLSIALIERNEERYLKEWIEYHILMGAEHFYIYDHGSTDDSMEVLSPYVNRGTVELISVEGEYLPTQISVYNDALDRARYHSEYLAFIDTDEFIVPMKHDRATDAIEEIFRTYEESPFKSPGSCAAGGIGINWRIYGSSGHKEPAEGLVIDEYRYRGPDRLMVNSHIKTICRPQAVDRIVNPHFAIYKPGYWCISEHGSLIPGAFFYDSIGDILRLNHYYVKSEQEYVSRRLNFKRSEAGRQRLATEEEITHTNEIYDDCICRFIDDVKNSMNGK